MNQLKLAEAEYARLRCLTPEDLETLTELIPFVSRDDANQVARPAPTASVEQVQQCYRARFEAAEARYGRMKALVCASLEEQMRLRSQICGQKVMEEMRGLNQNQIDFLLGSRSADESARREMVRHVWELLEQMRCLKEENARLKEMNARLRNGPVASSMELDEVKNDDAERCIALEAELAGARKRISALDMEVARLSHKTFDDDERVRECEDVFDRILGRVHRREEDMEHPRFHPMTTCADPACRNYAQRLRNSFKQAIAEAYVRERNVRIYGHFRYYADPVEKVRLEKDREIERLRLDMKRLERAACMTSSEAEAMKLEQLSVQVVLKQSELEQVRRNLKDLQAEYSKRNLERNRLSAAIEAMQEERREAAAEIEQAKSLQSIINAERAQLQREAEVVQKVKAQIEQFRSGSMATLFDEKRSELERLERELELLQEERKAIMDHKVQEGKSTSKTNPLGKKGKKISQNAAGSVVIACKECGLDIELEQLKQHMEEAHSRDVVLCPKNCGFFVLARRSSDMAKHVDSRSCAEAVDVIRQLREGGGE